MENEIKKVKNSKKQVDKILTMWYIDFGITVRYLHDINGEQSASGRLHRNVGGVIVCVFQIFI